MKAGVKAFTCFLLVFLLFIVSSCGTSASEQQDENIEVDRTDTNTNDTGTLENQSSTPLIPDLTVDDVSFSPATVKPGEIVSVTFTIKNQGDGSSGLFHNRISLATTVYGTDISLGNFEMPSIEPGESSAPVTITVTIPETVVSSEYFITVFTDGFKEVDELDEMNNIGSAPSVKVIPEVIEPVVPVASSIIDSVEAFVTTRQEGDQVIAELTLTAAGGAGGPPGSILWIEVNLIDPVAGRFKVMGHQAVDVAWSTNITTLPPHYDQLEIKRQDGEPDFVDWTYEAKATSYRYTSNPDAVNQFVPGCELELTVTVYMPDGSQETATALCTAQ